MKRFNYFVLSLLAGFVLFVTSCGDDDDNKLTNEVKLNATNSTFSFTSNDVAVEDLIISFGIDNSLLADYNKKNKTSFAALPEGNITFSAESATIKSGSKTSGVIAVTLSNTGLEPGDYVACVKMKSVTGGANIDQEANTCFFSINVEELPSETEYDFKYINISDYKGYNDYTLKNPIDLGDKYTIEIKFRAAEFKTGIDRLANFAVRNSSISDKPNLLRFGEAGNKSNQLEWLAYDKANVKVVGGTLFENDTWYMLSFVCTGSKFELYVDGNQDMTVDVAEGVTIDHELYKIELGMSWDDGTGYPEIQKFNGDIAEIRVWTTARTKEEIESSLCPIADKPTGLTAYWNFETGSGTTYKDVIGDNDMTWPNDAFIWGTDKGTCKK